MNLIKNKLYKSIPMMVACSIIFLFVALLSPLTWGAGNLNFKIIAASIGLGFICAYCITLYLDQYTNQEK